jgi:hypothetical protein
MKRECIHPPTAKLANKNPIPIRKQNDSGVCCATIEAGIVASLGRLAATAAAKVMPSVTSKKAIEPATARKAAKAAARPLVETGSRTPKKVNANPPRTELTNRIDDSIRAEQWLSSNERELSHPCGGENSKLGRLIHKFEHAHRKKAIV